MPTSSQLLPAMMSVLDRADETEALSRERLLASAQALGTAHTEQSLTEAVDWHLAQTVPAVAPPETPYVFPWKRPTSPSAQVKRIRRYRWSAWWDKAVVKWCFAGLTWLAFTLLIPQAFRWIVLALDPYHSALDVDFGSVFLGIVGSVLATFFLFYWVEQLAIKHRYFYPLKGNLNHTAAAYLTYAASRVYLRAMLSSDLPELLVGDAHYLEEIYSRERAAERKKKEIEERQSRQEKIVALRQRECETRMATFVEGLRIES